MKRNALAAQLVGFAIIASTSIAARAAEEPTSFRGIRLGSTLAEVRALPYPDADKRDRYRLICTGDKELREQSYEFSSLKALSRIGVTTCAYFLKAASTYIRGGVDIANVGAYETTFHFTPVTLPEGERNRLYLIKISPAAEHFDTIVDALATRYGPATSSATQSNQTVMGANVTNKVAAWDGQTAQIAVVKYNETTRSSLVTFSHKALTSEVNKLTDALKAENAKKL